MTSALNAPGRRRREDAHARQLQPVAAQQLLPKLRPNSREIEAPAVLVKGVGVAAEHLDHRGAEVRLARAGG